MKKRYLRIEFELTSPLAVGSGENQTTDEDLIRDSSGRPYIPGSALAGVYRDFFPEKEAEDFFGPKLKFPDETELDQSEIKDTEADSLKGGDLRDSKVITYDAVISEHSGEKGQPKREHYVSRRDMVALDEFKVSRPGAKFDFEVLEPGCTFVTYLEMNLDPEDTIGTRNSQGSKGLVDPLNVIAQAYQKGRIALGAKTSRGYGRIQIKEEGIKEASFDLDDRPISGIPDPEKGVTGLEKWLKFDLYNAKDPNWKSFDARREEAELPKRKLLRILLTLAPQGGISIRQYSTAVGDVDYMQLHLHDLVDENGKVIRNGSSVIPGTSWAGAFQAQMRKLGMSDAELKEWFGYKNQRGKKGGRRSAIQFSESQIRGGRSVEYTRNAIDRFTQGTISGALYSERTHYGGKLNLEISIDFSGLNSPSRADVERFLRTLAAAIMDLDAGYLAVGGLTAIGRGLFCLTELSIEPDETELTLKEKEIGYESLTARLLGAFDILNRKESA